MSGLFPHVGPPRDLRGSAKTVHGPAAFIRQCRNSDLILVFQEARTVQVLAMAFLLLPFLQENRSSVVDLLLAKPEGLRQRLSAVIKRVAFWRIDHFVHYFRDVSGYQKYFGIGPDRSSFVWFKANIREHLDVQPDSDGQYILCFGSTQRDYDTFFRAVWSLPYRAAIPKPNLFQPPLSWVAFFCRSGFAGRAS